MAAVPCWLALFRGGGKREADGSFNEEDEENINAAVGALLINELRR